MSQVTEDQGVAPPAGEGDAAAGAAAAPETQRQRWVKYGANVALNVVLVLAIAAIAIWGTGKYRKRIDTTYAGTYSLKPQTVNIIQGLDKEVTLVCLYPKLKQEDNEQQDFRQPVLDLLEEYRLKGRNIKVRAIDSVNDLTQYSAWLREVTQKYGGNIKGYEEALKAFPATLQQIRGLADAEAGRFEKLVEKLQGGQIAVRRDQVRALQLAYSTVASFPRILQDVQDQVEADTKATEKRKGGIRNFKAQKDAVESSLGAFSERVGLVVDYLSPLTAGQNAPPELSAYAAESLPKFGEMRKQADGLLKRIRDLGDLKLDELRTKLQPSEEGKAPESAIAVMGPDDVKLIAFEDVWKSGEQFGMGRADDAPKLRFAGEQRITAAMMALTQKERAKVAFVRAGGPALTTPSGGNPMMGGGGQPAPMKEIVDRLRAYNFDVVEKDVAGPPQPDRMGMPPAPEPSDEELKAAIWVVVNWVPPTPMSPMGGGGGGAEAAAKLAARLDDHLKQGGSALVLMESYALTGRPTAVDNMEGVLKGWGIEAKTDTIAVHEPVKAAGGGASGDMIEDAKRQPPIFVLNQYGDHEIGKAVRALDGVFIFPGVVKVLSPPKGVSVTPLVPIPTLPKAWGERDFATLSRDDDPTYTPGTGARDDMAGPLYLGAAAERTGGAATTGPTTAASRGGRLVVLGSAWFAFDQFINFPDLKLRDKYKVNVARFPGNGELFTNSVFWLSHKEGMMALSPAAMEVSRIAPLSPGALNFWRVGVLLIGLPALSIIAGFFVFFARRD